MDLRITSGSETELNEFLRLCQKIQFLGQVGSSRTINVSVDGDGSARLKFGVLGANGECEEIPMPKFETPEAREEYLTEMEQSIGE